MTHHLVGLAEVAQLLGVSRPRAHQLSQTEDFPEPIVTLAAGPVWETADVEDWARRVGRLDAD